MRMLRLPVFIVLLALLPAGGAGYAHGTDTAREQVRLAAERLLAERFPDDAARLQVRVLRLGGRLDEAEQVRVRLRALDGLPRAHTQVDVLVPAGAGGWHKAGWALLYVAHFDSVVVARNDLDEDAAVSPDDVTVAWMEVTTFRGEPLRADAFRALLAGGLYAHRRLRAGRALRQDDLRPAYAAQTGDAVVMRYQRGPITLRLTCKAREPGFVGDVIRLYYPDADVVYRARLTGAGTAEWVETR